MPIVNAATYKQEDVMSFPQIAVASQAFNFPFADICSKLQSIYFHCVINLFILS